MAIDWKTILSEFDGKPTLLQAIGKLRKAVEDEKITIEQAQTEIDNLEAQQKVDEAKIEANATAIQSARLEAEQALSLAQTNETDIGTLDGQVAVIELLQKALVITSTTTALTEEQYNLLKNNTTYQLKFEDRVYSYCFEDATYLYYNCVAGTAAPFTHYRLSLSKDSRKFARQSTNLLYANGIKTLFGNQSIVGKGNIDLYKHNIQIQKGSGGSPSTLVFLSIVSSSNLKVDSLTDLKQLLNLDDYGFYPVSGICETTGIAVTINKSQDVLKITSVKNGNLSEYTIVDETITDTVTTI